MTRLWDTTVYMYFYKHYWMIYTGNYPQTRKNWLPSQANDPILLDTQWFELDHAQLQSSLATLQRAIQSPVVFCGRPRGQKVGKTILLDTSCVHGMHPKTRRFLHHDHKMVPGNLSCWILRDFWTCLERIEWYRMILVFHSHRIHGAAIYGNIYHHLPSIYPIYVSIYIYIYTPAPWILYGTKSRGPCGRRSKPSVGSQKNAWSLEHQKKRSSRDPERLIDVIKT